jgi:hypothetical protein
MIFTVRCVDQRRRLPTFSTLSIAGYVAVIATSWVVLWWAPNLAIAVAPAPAEIDLSGDWKLALDPDDVGISQGWFHRGFEAPFSRSANLPGSLESQGIGNAITVDTPWVGSIIDRAFFTSDRYARYRRTGQIKVPFFLQPETYYRGPAWRRRTVVIPDAWRHQRVVLELERCHWTTQVWFDGVQKGSGDSLCTPHRFELTTDAVTGNHDLVVRVDNRLFIDVGQNAHSVTDHTQGNWNGIVGAVRLVATPRVWIERVAVIPDVQRRLVRIVVSTGNVTDGEHAGRLRISARATKQPSPFDETLVSSQQIVPPGRGEFEFSLRLGDGAMLWDEFHPHLFELVVDWIPEDMDHLTEHSRTTRFGLREVGVDGTQLALNGRKLFLRGTLECNVFPLTGFPATDVVSWKRIMQICREHGLNHVRFHSNCPPEAAFVAADELGLYLQVECGVWANWTASIGNGEPVDALVHRETERILAEYGNHPSFLLMSHGNEPAGPDEGAEYLTQWIEKNRELDGRRLYTGGSGWPMIPANQFHVTSQPRIYHWGDGSNSRINAHPPETRTDYRGFVASADRPVIAHEIGQWCVYPNFDEIPKYTGHLKPRNFEIFRDLLANVGLAEQAHDFLMASGALQVLCYKEEIESALRTPGFVGFQLLGLSDFPGQGTAPVGVLDAFWDAKPYIDAASFRRFCGPTVPLARLDRRCFATDQAVAADLELAHYGPSDLIDATVEWKLELVRSGAAISQGEFKTSAPTGNLTPIGSITAPLASVAGPAKLRLIVRVPEAAAENDWDLWVYPAGPPVESPPDIHVCSELDEPARRHLSRGGKLLVMLPADRIATDRVLGFSSIFWNTAWTENQTPHTLGILCDPTHPLFADFPTEAHSNWQWWELLYGAAAMELDASFAAVQPLVQVVPDWFDPKKLALAFEARVGGGRVLTTSMDLTTNLENRPAARQFRTSLLKYMTGEQFQPRAELSVEQIEGLVE